jgi:hypothetical protein
MTTPTHHRKGRRCASEGINWATPNADEDGEGGGGAGYEGLQLQEGLSIDGEVPHGCRNVRAACTGLPLNVAAKSVEETVTLLRNGGKKESCGEREG